MSAPPPSRSRTTARSMAGPHSDQPGVARRPTVSFGFVKGACARSIAEMPYMGRGPAKLADHRHELLFMLIQRRRIGIKRSMSLHGDLAFARKRPTDELLPRDGFPCCPT